MASRVTAIDRATSGPRCRRSSVHATGRIQPAKPTFVSPRLPEQRFFEKPRVGLSVAAVPGLGLRGRTCRRSCRAVRGGELAVPRFVVCRTLALWSRSRMSAPASFRRLLSTVMRLDLADVEQAALCRRFGLADLEGAGCGIAVHVPHAPGMLGMLLPAGRCRGADRANPPMSLAWIAVELGMIGSCDPSAAVQQRQTGLMARAVRPLARRRPSPNRPRR